MITPVKIYIGLLLLILPSVLHAQNLNANWNNDLKSALQEFLTCKDTPGDNNRCSRFIGQALNTVYKVNDFYSPKLNRYMAVNEIADFLKGSDKWTLLGHAYEQKVLTSAQENANGKKAVVAVYVNAAGVGNVVIVTPGALQKSGSWNLDVPNSASFFASQPDKSFVDKGLSFAFGKNLMKDILIYSRN